MPRSSPASIRTRPSMMLKSTVDGAVNTIAASGSCTAAPGHRQGVDAHADEVGGHPRFEGADIVATQNRGAAARGQVQRAAGSQCRRIAAGALKQHRRARFAQHVRGIVGRRAVDAQPQPHPGGRHRTQRRDARPQAQVGVGTMRGAGPRSAQAFDLGRRRMHHVGEPDIGSDPAEFRRQLDRPAARSAPGSTVLRRAFHTGGCASCTPALRASGSALAHEIRRNRKRRARREHDARHREAFAVVIGRR